MKKHVLIVDDDQDFSALLADCLRKTYQAEVTVVHSAYAAMNELLDRLYDLVVLDWNLGGLSGPSALQKVDQALSMEDRFPLNGVGSKIPVTILSGYDPAKLKSMNRNRKHFQVSHILSKTAGMPKICETLRNHFPEEVRPAV